MISIAMRSGIKRRSDLPQRPQGCDWHHASKVSMVRNEVALIFYSWSLRARAISGMAEYTTEIRQRVRRGQRKNACHETYLSYPKVAEAVA
jgi:hypothetical protein